MILVLDNYDSFTYNLVHYFQELGEEVRVARNDTLSAEECFKIRPKAVVISPGPCSPNEAGVSLPFLCLNKGRVPVLGVCLGHQAIGQAYGATVHRVSPVHGKTSEVRHQGDPLFTDVPSSFVAARYHSLAVTWDENDDSIPLKAIARTPDGMVMALRHTSYPVVGVQFHPESIASESGKRILKNFLSMCQNEASPA